MLRVAGQITTRSDRACLARVPWRHGLFFAFDLPGKDEEVPPDDRAVRFNDDVSTEVGDFACFGTVFLGDRVFLLQLLLYVCFGPCMFLLRVALQCFVHRR